MKEMRIIIRMDGDYQDEQTSDILDDVRQACMRRNPIDEPSIYVESKIDGSWKIDDSTF